MENIGNVRAWADLPSDVLNLIFSLTYEKDCIRFRLTCKSWQSVPIPIRQYSITTMQSEWSQQYFPWLLMFSKRRSLGIFHLFNPISNETYMMEIPELADAMFHCSKYGWLLMSKGRRSLFFFNPFTRCTINLPDLHYDMEFVSMSFTAPPTSSECKVYGYELFVGVEDRHEFYTWTCIRGAERWSLQAEASETKSQLIFKSVCTPVFYKDVFYHLDVNGRLAVFDSQKEDKTLMWDDLPKPRPEKMISCSDAHPKYYLAECDGEFVSVFVGHSGNPVHVYKLDWSEMEWMRVESLGNKTMFINDTGSLLISSKLKGTEDRIYFPSFKSKINGTGDYLNRRFDPSPEDEGNEGVFYSLRTNKYHAFGSGVFSHGEWTAGTIFVHNCVWIEPNDNTISKGVPNDDEQQLLHWFDHPLPQDNNENEDEDQWDGDDGNDDLEEEIENDDDDVEAEEEEEEEEEDGEINEEIIGEHEEEHEEEVDDDDDIEVNEEIIGEHEEEHEEEVDDDDDIEVNEEIIGEHEEEPALEEEEEEEDCEKQMDVVEINEELEEEDEDTASCALFPTSGFPFVVYNHRGRGYKQTFVSISQGTCFVRSVPDMREMMCFASSHGWLVMLNGGYYSTQCFLWNPISMEKIELPPVDNAYSPNGGCVLTSSPPDCVIMFVGMDDSCIFCRPNDQRWTRKYLRWKPDSYVSRTAVCCKGNIYICFEQGVSIKLLDYTTEHNTNDGNRLRVEKINLIKSVGDLLENDCYQCKDSYLVESCGEVFLVLKLFRSGIEEENTLALDFIFNVFRLNYSSSSSSSGGTWEKVESLGYDRVFFLGDGISSSMSASKLEMKENYIFFLEYDRRLYAFNMEDQTTSVALPYPHSFDPEYSPYWVFI